MGEQLAEEEAQDDPLATAIAHVIDVAGELMGSDPAIRSVGVGRTAQGSYEYVALRVDSRPLASRAAAPLHKLPETLAGMPVRVERHAKGPEVLATIIAGATATSIPEQSLQRPLVCGLRIQNFDHDARAKKIPAKMTVGSLGCFVRLEDGSIALLSNNHVIAGENAAKRGSDRVLQPPATAFAAGSHIATLTTFATLLTSSVSARPKGPVLPNWNDVDAAVAALDGKLKWSQGYLPARKLGPLVGIAVASPGDDVYMVGSQSGDRYGTVKTVGTVVGPIAYGIGNCWFQRSIAIAGNGGKRFAAAGDSGAVVVRKSDDRVLGLLYAASPTQAWACPIDEVFKALNCTFA